MTTRNVGRTMIRWGICGVLLALQIGTLQAMPPRESAENAKEYDYGPALLPRNPPGKCPNCEEDDDVTKAKRESERMMDLIWNFSTRLDEP